MSLETKHLYDFGGFRLDIAEKVLRQGDQIVLLTPKMFDTLALFVENAGHLLEKGEMFEKLWEGRQVEESNLTFNVGMLRKALGDDAANPKFIETVPRRGYRFIAEVTPVGNGKPLVRELSETGSQNGVEDPGISARMPRQEAENLHPTSPHPPVETSSRGIVAAIRGRTVFYSVLMVLIGAVFLTGFLMLSNRQPFYQRLGLHGPASLSIERLTNTGEANGINISADGKFLVYFTNKDGKNTIWLRLEATGKSIPIYATADESIVTTSFSRNGEYVFFTHQRSSEPLKLSRISTLGGAPTLILSGLHNGYSISPDEGQLAFARFDDHGSHLMIADADGENEHEVLTGSASRHFNSIKWSPNGKSIAYCAEAVGNGTKALGIYEFDLADKSERSLTEFKWSWLENVTWLPDQSGMLVTAREKVDSSSQIWLLSLTDGHVEQLTNNSSSLSIRGATADFTKILAVEEEWVANVWVASKNDPSDARPIARSEYDVAWMPNGRILFQARDATTTDIWLTNADGADKIQLTLNESSERGPIASPDGHFIVYVSTRSGQPNIWRMDADGGEQIQLTNTGGEGFPIVTPDGRWVFYTRIADKTLWRVPLGGGDPEQISTEKHRRVSISPDGSKLAHVEFIEGRAQLLIEGLPGCVPIRRFETNVNEASFIRVVWAKDGKSVIYFASDSAQVGNLWQQALDGSKPRRVTNFSSERIEDFDISPDDGQIAIIRGETNVNAVLLQVVK